MNRIANIALAVLAAVVVAASIYVIKNNKAPADRHAAAGPESVAAQQSPIGSPRTTTARAASPTLGVDASSASTSASPVVAFLGDDWTAGIGASSKSHRFTTLVCAQLHAVERNFGVDGTGYAKTSSAGGTYSSRVQAVVAANPQVVVVSGGRNDSSDDAATAAAAAKALFAKLHAALPNTVLIAVAPFWGDSDLPPAMAALGSAVNKAVTDAGGSYVDIPDPIHGHPDYMSDAADPNDMGYAAIAAALEPQIQLLLPR